MSLCSPSAKADKNRLLVAFPSPTSKTYLRNLEYLDILGTTYRDRGLSVLTIINAPQPGLVERYQRRLNLRNPLINDTAGAISDYFHVRNSAGGLLLIDETDTVRCVLSSYLDDHTTRQIVESEILGLNKIAFKKEEFDAQFAPKQDLDSIRLYDVESLNERRLKDILSGRPALLTFVDPMCIACEGESVRVETLKKISWLFEDRVDIIYITSTSSPFLEVKNSLKKRNFPGRYYATAERLLRVNEYCTHPALKKAITSIIVDQKGLIEYRERFELTESELYTDVIRYISNHQK
jgi:hypothetical protein